MGAVSVVTTVKWFWFLVSVIALGGIIVSLARSFKVPLPSPRKRHSPS
jgi:hypothetical protein